jgi:hypothetical protein
VTEAVLDRPSCLNCGAALTGPFCAGCGQKAAAGPPTVRDFLKDVAEELFDVDGRVFRSLRLLFFRPGFLTRELFDGRRASYVRPLRLYLICSVTAFGVIALTSAGADGQVQTEEQQFLELLPQFMFVMVPAFALIVMLVMRKSRRTYPQHMYFALHVHAVMFALTAATMPLDLVDSRTVRGLAALARVVLTVAYGFVALRTAYGGGWGPTVSRGMVILAAYTVWMFVFVFGMVAVYVRWWA